MAESKQDSGKQARGTGTQNTARQRADDAPEQGAAGDNYTGPQAVTPLDNEKRSVPQSGSPNDAEPWPDPNGLYHTGTSAETDDSAKNPPSVGMSVHERISEHLGIPVEERGPLYGIDQTPSNQR